MATDTKGYVEPGAGLKAEEAERAKDLNLRIAYYMRKDGLSETAAKAKAIEELGGKTKAAEEARKAARLAVPLPPPKPSLPPAKPSEPAPKVAAPKPAVKSYSGVALRGGKIHPYWTVDGKIKFGASRPTEKEAAEERDRMLVELNGFKAVASRLNFPEMFRPKEGAAAVEAEARPQEPPDPRGWPRTIYPPIPDEPAPEPDQVMDSLAKLAEIGAPDDIERSIASFDRPARTQDAEPPAVVYDPREPEAVPHGAPVDPPAEVKAYDPIERPSHYDLGGFQAIDVIEAMGCGEEFCIGNAVKYVLRAGRKGGETKLQDIKKARWYLDRYITSMERAVSNG